LTHEFRGSVAVIAGGAHGIGRGVAAALADRGALVVVADVDREACETLDRNNSGIVTVVADLTTSSGPDSVVAETLRRHDRIDILVNAVGGFSQIENTEEMDEATWTRGIALNLTSAFLCVRSVIPTMRGARHGRIVNIASEAGRMPISPTAAYYAAGKAGLIGLTKYLAMELGPAGITVNCVAPGTTLSERVRSLSSADRLAMIADRTPMGRLAEIEDQIGPILFLASESAHYVTGATIDVSGGRIML
jgi:NAD(P)-dependent dehydrogenase (short-subunit alcohol dehydrogenase family)